MDSGFQKGLLFRRLVNILLLGFRISLNFLKLRLLDRMLILVCFSSFIDDIRHSIVLTPRVFQINLSEFDYLI